MQNSKDFDLFVARDAEAIYLKYTPLFRKKFSHWDRDSNEDLMQEAYFIVLKALDWFNASKVSNVETWCAFCTLNAFINKTLVAIYKKKSREINVDPVTFWSSRKVLTESSSPSVYRDFLRLLQGEDKKLFEYVLQGHSISSLCEELGLPYYRVKKKLAVLKKKAKSLHYEGV